MKNILSLIVLLACFQINVYGDVDVSKIGKNVRSCIENENISDITTMKKIFHFFQLNEDMLNNNHFKHEFKTALYLCKRDGDCKMKVKKAELLRLSNAYDGRKYRFTEKDMDDVYYMVEQIDYIMNKMVDDSIQKLKSNDDEEMIQIISTRRDLNYNDVFKKISSIYNYDFLKSRMFQDLEYTSTFAECKNSKKTCLPQNNHARKQYLEKLSTHFSQNEIKVFVEFFDDIDRIKKNIATTKQKKAEAEKLAIKQKKEKEENEQKAIFNSLNIKSKALGYRGYAEGIEDLLYRLKNGFTSFDVEKKYVYGISPHDDFVVNGIVDDYVIYIKRHDPDTKIAILKRPGKLYQEGSYLDSDLFLSLQKIQEFKTVLGATKQVIVFKEINLN